jgi:hypothetical protein
MRRRKVENTKTGGATAIYTLSSWHCCRDAMLRVFFGNNGKETTPVRHCGLNLQSPFFRFIRRESSFMRREASRLYNGKETTPVRHCGLAPQSPFFRFIRRESSFMRREASRLYISDSYCYTVEMSRKGLNMYNPLQAKRSWGYRKTTTLSELRSSSICYHINHANQINHSSDKRGRKDEGTKGRKAQTTSISSWLACLLLVACCLLP